MTPRDRRALIIFGVVAVVALAAYLLLLRKSSGPTAALPTPTQTSTVVPTPSPVPSVTTSPTPRTTTPPPVLVGGRDPFSPLVQASGGGGGPTTPPTVPPTSPTTVPPTTPSVSPPASPPPTPVGGTTTVIGGHTVTLIDIFHRNGVKYAQVSVDGTVYTVKQGQTFDGNFKLVDPSGGCATFLFGDQQFQLCESPQK
jgi:hypothetical protein